MSNSSNNDGWLTPDQIRDIGFKSVGDNVLISSTCKIYGSKNISIGSNVRIDDFCVIASSKGSLVIEGFNHIGAFCYFNCNGGVHINLLATISSRCTIYSSTDDFSGSHLISPMVPHEYTKVTFGKVTLGRNSLLGTCTTILPNVSIGDYTAIGACSLVTKSIDSKKIAAGTPAKIIKERNLEIIDLEKEFLYKRGKNV